MTNQITISPDQLENLVAQFAPGTIKSPRDASYDPHAQLYTFSDEIAAVVNAAFGNLSAGVSQRLRDYAANARYNKEVGGITVNGAAVPTDRETQSKFVSAAVMAQLNPQITFEWKTDGGFLSFTAEQLIAVATAVGTHVQACFSIEAAMSAGITAGTVTTTAQVDTAFAAIA